MPYLRADHPVTILHRRLFIQHAPVRHHAVAVLSLSENFSLRPAQNGWRTYGRCAGGAEKTATGKSGSAAGVHGRCLAGRAALRTDFSAERRSAARRTSWHRTPAILPGNMPA